MKKVDSAIVGEGAGPVAGQLPEDLLWAEGGHASDVVLTALSDGQTEIVPATVLAHIDACTTCTKHLGNAALLSLHVGRELALVATEADAAARAPFPRLAVALGLVVAVIGILPTLLSPGLSISNAKSFATHDAPLLAAGASTLARRLFDPSSPFATAITYGTAAFLVLGALLFVRLLPQKEVSR